MANDEEELAEAILWVRETIVERHTRSPEEIHKMKLVVEAASRYQEMANERPDTDKH